MRQDPLLVERWLTAMGARYGPATEGMAIFGIGIVVLVFTALWIAGKS